MLIATAKDAAALLAPLFSGCAGEMVVVAHLDGDLNLIEAREGKHGSHDRVDLPIRSIIEEALRLRSEGLIVAHNHPSGDLQPSPEDLRATRELSATAASLGIQLHDHLIVGPGRRLPESARLGPALGQAGQVGILPGSGLGARASNWAK